MKKRVAVLRGYWGRLLPVVLLAAVLVSAVGAILFGGSQRVAAATNSTMNFQARLMNGAGAIAADGDYNVEFKIYTASSSSGSSQGSCTGDAACVWTETRVSTDKVHVVNGYLTVNLGSVTAFGSTITWDQQLWMTMNVGGTGSPSWDGEMSPRLKLTAVPYAFRAGALAGGTGANTTTLDTGTPSGTNLLHLPAESGTLCVQSSVSCGFLTGSASSYIQNGTSVQTGANFAIRSNASGSVTAVMQGTTGQSVDILDIQTWNGTSATTVASVGNTGAFTAVGVNSGSGLLQGTGGLTLSGAVSINTTGSASTTIGSGTGTLAIDSTNFDVSTAGALSGITTIATSSTINGQTISSAANFTGTLTVAGASPLVLGTSTTNTGSITFLGSGGPGTLKLAGPTTPNASNYTLTIPAITNNANVCTDNSVCTGYQASGNYANTSLSNLSSVAINTALLPGTTSIDLGSNANAFRDLYLGGSATNNFRFTGTAGGARTITLDDLTGHLGLVQTAGSSTAQTGDLNVSGSLIAGTALQAPLVKSADVTGASAAITVRSGNSTTSGNTGDLSVTTGTATAGNSGNISIDSGGASGTKGTVSIGGTNASALNLGRTGSTTDSLGSLRVAANQNFSLLNGTGTFAQTYASNTGTAATWAVTDNASSGTTTVQGVAINLTGTNNAGGTNTITGLNFGNVTPATNNTFNGISFGTGMTSLLTYNGAPLINGTGIVQSAAISGSYTGITGVGTLTAGTWNASTIDVSHGGTGVTSATAYALVAGGTTSTGALQSLTSGTSGQLLKSNGNAALPSWVNNTQANTCSDCANTSLSNLASVAINTSLLSGGATIDLGSNANPFRDLYLGGTATNNFRFTGTAGGARTITLDDLSGHLALVQTAGSSTAQTGDLNVNGTLIAGTALQGTLIKSADVTGASSAVTLRTGNSTTSGNTGDLTIATGAATSGNSGNISVDSGGASGTKGTVSIGGTNASALNLGRTGFTADSLGSLRIAANQNLTLQSGTGTYSQTYSNTTGTAATFAATDSASSGTTTVQGVAINLAGTNNAGGTNTINGLAFGNVSAATNNTFNALNFGTGFTNLLALGATSLISGAGKVQNAAIDTTVTYSNLLKVGALDTGSIASGFGTISTGNNITTTAIVQGGTGVFTAANGLTLGTSSSATGGIIFKGSGGPGTLTLAGPNTPNASNYTLSIPAITGPANVCTDNAICSGYAASPTGTGFYLQQVPTNNTTLTAGANVIAPTAASVVGLTINGTGNATSAQALIVNQPTTASTATTAEFNSLNSSGTQTNGVLIQRNNASGTTTNLLRVANTAGTATNGISVAGDYATALLALSSTTSSATGIAITGTYSTNQISGTGFAIDPSGNLTLSGAGTDITFANGEKIDNDTNGQINLQSNSGAVTVLLTGTSNVITSSTSLSITSAATTNIGITPGSTGDVVFTHGDGSQHIINTTTSTDQTINLTDITSTNSASASTGTINVLAVRNLNESSSATGTPDSLIYATNLDANESVTNGILLEQATAGGTLDTGLRILQSAGTINNGLLFGGTIGTDITTASGRDLTVVANGGGIIILNDTVRVGTLGAVVNATSQAVCRDTATGNLTACDSGAGGKPFIQGGNTFAAAATLGTNDNFDLTVERNNTAYMTLTTSPINEVLFGSNISLAMQGATAYITNAQTQTNSESFGNTAAVTNQDATAIGFFARAAGSRSVALGSGAYAHFDDTITIGNLAESFNNGAIAIGTQAKAGFDSYAIGYQADSSGFNASIAIGQLASTTASNQIVIGSDDVPMTQLVLGSGAADPTAPSSATIQASGAGTTSNLVGGSLTLAGGVSTGSAVGGNVVIATASAGGAGGSQNSLTTRATFDTTNKLYLGNGVTAAAPNAFTVQGTGSTVAATAGGALTVLGGAGASTTTGSDGGAVTVQGGTAGGTGARAGGAVSVVGGTASGTGAGGTATLQGGASNATAGSAGGAVAITGGAGTSTGTGAAGGNVTITAGSAGGSAANNGGNIVARLGAATSTGVQGSFQVQNALGASQLTLDPSNTAASLNMAQNSGGETGGTPPTGWSAHGGAGNPTQTTTAGLFASGSGGIAQATTAATHGVRNALNATALADNTTYVVSFSIKTSVTITNANLVVEYYRTTTGPTLDATCSSFTQATINTTNFVKYTCSFLTSGTAKSTTNFLAIRQADGTARTIYIDNLSIVAQNAAGTQNTGVLKVGGASGQGLTLLTLDTYATTPFTGANSSLAGSMYYDTTALKIQCYDGSAWGACGAAPNSIVTITPEYAGAVLNGSLNAGPIGVGTMTSDFCANSGALTVGTLCAANDARNFYKWTSPQPTLQTYYIYVTYKLPATFKAFIAGTTSMTGLVDHTTNASLKYAIFKSTGSAITSCSALSTVVGWTGSSALGSANTWTTGIAGTLSGTTDPSTCGFVAGNNVIFQIAVSADINASSYAENLNFTYSNQ